MSHRLHVYSRFQLLVPGLMMLLAAACGDDGSAIPFEDQVLVSYEAVPSAQLETWNDADLGATAYEDRAALTRDVYQALWPDMVAAVGLDIAGIETLEAPGGYLLATNPSLQSAFASGAVARADIERFAAAQGYVFRQWDILLTDFGSANANTGFAVIEIPGLTPDLAQAFFAHAAGVDMGLGGGYTAFDDDMLFLNLRDSGTGEPYSGLDDAAFIAALETAAASFGQGDALVVSAGEQAVEAWFVSNDWDVSTQGEDFAALLAPAEVQALDDLRAQHDAMVSDWLAASGAARVLGVARAGSWGRPDSLGAPRAVCNCADSLGRANRSAF